MEQNRYFLVWFSGVDVETGEPRSGRVEFQIEDGFYINEIHTLDTIAEAFDIKDVFIKNILEVSEKDFYTFTAGRDEGNSETEQEDTLGNII